MFIFEHYFTFLLQTAVFYYGFNYVFFAHYNKHILEKIRKDIKGRKKWGDGLRCAKVISHCITADLLD